MHPVLLLPQNKYLSGAEMNPNLSYKRIPCQECGINVLPSLTNARADINIVIASIFIILRKSPVGSFGVTEPPPWF